MEDGQTIYLSSSSFLPWSARDEKHFKMRIFGFLGWWAFCRNGEKAPLHFRRANQPLAAW